MPKTSKHYSYSDLNNLLINKKALVGSKQYSKIKKHVDECNFCWNLWNRVRWDRAMENNGTKELEDYFGECFIPYFDSSWALANQWYKIDPKTEEEVSTFYKSTPFYIYNSYIFNKSGDKISYIPQIKNIIEEHNIKSILDYGSGIGVDGLEFLNMGIDMHFTDYISPSIDFLRWRLKRKGYHNAVKQIYDVENIGDNPPEVDMIWSIDVMEHMVNPMKIFDAFTDKTKAFVFYIDSSGQDGGRHPFHFQVNFTKIRNELKKMGFKNVKHDFFEVWVRKV